MTYILSRAVSKLSQIIVQILDEKRALWVFESHFGGLEATYTVNIGFIGKLVVDFLVVLVRPPDRYTRRP